MKENKYDDSVFFEKYSQMERSQKGLEGAGEWPELHQLMPDFAGKDVLDLGCGYGWHSVYAAMQGARSVIACDISEKMIQKAMEINSMDNIEYRVEAFEDSDFPKASFDVVIASLMLHYLPSYEDFLQKVHAWLRPGGILLFNVEHPVFTSRGDEDWYYDDQGNILHYPVDNYFIEGSRSAVFLGETVTKYHRTLTHYVDGLLTRGFSMMRLREPQPTAKALEQNPYMKDELRRPMMLIIKAQKL